MIILYTKSFIIINN